MKNKIKKTEKYRAVASLLVALVVLLVTFFWFSRTPDCGPPHSSTLQAQNAEQYPAPCYEGLTDQEAKEKAKNAGFNYRVVEADGEARVITSDYSVRRVNVTLSEGKVVKAEFY